MFLLNAFFAFGLLMAKTAIPASCRKTISKTVSTKFNSDTECMTVCVLRANKKLEIVFSLKFQNAEQNNCCTC